MSRKPQETTGESAEDPDYVNAAPCSQEEKDEPTTDHKRLSFFGPFLPVVLWLPVLVIMVFRIYVTSVMSGNITTLTTGNQDLTTQNQDLTTQNQDLTTQNQDLTTQNQQLETQRNNLTKQIQQMESVEANISRAEWAFREYCYKKTGESKTSCRSCQRGWLNYQQGCYSYNNLGQQNWEGAQKDCEGKISTLAVAHTETEKKYLRTISADKQRYWIGLRVVDGKWKWVDGSDLTEPSWVDPPAPSAGHCALSVPKENKWKSVNCGDINPWICGKTAVNPSTGQ
ncbi:uncharacterized protein V6R79_009589 [Siganus canaliculatus]